MRFFRLRHFMLCMSALLFGRGHAQTVIAPDSHRSLVIYQVMVASFRHSPDGPAGYSAMWGPDGHTKNGNIRGITEALDHISSLGANAVWLTPVFDSSLAPIDEKLKATGYFTNDYFSIDPNFGSEEDFRHFVDSAHERGLYVILDGVFGHHGGADGKSPSGYTIDARPAISRDGSPGNVSYPGSLPYFKEVATYWMDRYGIDGWRLDQAYQAIQGGHNYWLDIREAVEKKAAERKAAGKKWGTLAYMVGEDWGDAETVNSGVYDEGGLLSAFDFDGKELISGEMQDPSEAGLANGWDDVVTVLSDPMERGYLNNHIIPNLFLSNHDGYRLADRFDPADSMYYNQIKTRYAVLAAYNGPVTMYYGDEYADRSLETTGGQKDNISRTSGHIEPRNDSERELRDYISRAFAFRADNPAMWRGDTSFDRIKGDADVLVVYKKDRKSGNSVAVVFADADTSVDVRGAARPVAVRAFEPAFIKLR